MHVLDIAHVKFNLFVLIQPATHCCDGYINIFNKFNKTYQRYCIRCKPRKPGVKLYLVVAKNNKAYQLYT